MSGAEGGLARSGGRAGASSWDASAGGGSLGEGESARRPPRSGFAESVDGVHGASRRRGEPCRCPAERGVGSELAGGWRAGPPAAPSVATGRLRAEPGQLCWQRCRAGAAPGY